MYYFQVLDNSIISDRETEHLLWLLVVYSLYIVLQTSYSSFLTIYMWQSGKNLKNLQDDVLILYDNYNNPLDKELILK